ncbi:Uu.00g087850.m01.CDS01 [Anthostomella pinea]|uniref:Uu.00g087850.m01.CDS01 n=1 Tax=Anthostomella pinea TaxID=933095 RepID=A0AAI8VME4_9PEZI|nr:Uu.00g087850.m01.CDS01 [Anthostomella pinea]
MTQEYLQQWSGPSDLIRGHFFFWRPGEKLQSSFQGLLRGLLHAILGSSPNLIQQSFPSTWQDIGEDGDTTVRTEIDDEDIELAFESLIQCRDTYTDNKFVFFIDGLDELNDTRRGLNDSHSQLVKRLKSWCTDSEGRVKMCVASREWPVFQRGFGNCPKIRLQDLTRTDMIHYTHDFLSQNDPYQDLGISPERTERFVYDIVNKSAGVFLWLALVLRDFDDGLENGDEIEHLREKLDQLPEEVEELFSHLLRSISPGDKSLRSLQPLDEMIEGVISRLEDAGVLDQTYIFYTTDNGYHIGQHRFQPGKQSAFEEDINIPLIVRGPGIAEGMVTDVVTTHTDLAPTLLKLAGAELRSDFDGAAIPLASSDIFLPSSRRPDTIAQTWLLRNKELKRTEIDELKQDRAIRLGGCMLIT